MSVYVHYAPYHLRGSTWEISKRVLLDRVVATLERFAPGLTGTIVEAETITPFELERDYGFAGGHVFHGELAVDQLFMMRPVIGYGRYTTPIAGLYHCGGGSHPGGFMSGASGKLAAQAVLKGVERWPQSMI